MTPSTTSDPQPSSPTTDSSADAPTARRRPGNLFYVGIFLWAAVFVSFYYARQARQTDATGAGPATEGAGVDGELVTIRPATTATDPDDTGASSEPIEVTMTWSENGIADFTFQDSEGANLSKNDLLGMPWIASFIFTRCAGPCTAVTASMQTLHQRYQDKPVQFVTFTVDPDRDTPEVLATYKKFWAGESSNWHFLTGDKDQIYGLINGSFLMPVAPAPRPEPGWEIIHTKNVCLVDATGRVVGKYLSDNPVEIAELKRDLQRLFDVDAITNGGDSALSNPAARAGEPDSPATSASGTSNVDTVNDAAPGTP